MLECLLLVWVLELDKCCKLDLIVVYLISIMESYYVEWLILSMYGCVYQIIFQGIILVSLRYNLVYRVL